MASEGGATGYIVHHLTPLSVGEGFWTFHLDTLFFSVLLGSQSNVVFSVRNQKRTR